jgi:metal-dependent hydrolase (beta-lactamase superfamily II)
MKPKRRQVLRAFGAVAAGLVAVAAVAFVLRYREFRRDVARADQQWNEVRPARLGDIGSTRELSILPLLDWHKSRDEFAIDVGVSYLLKTDQHTILFDLGNNSEDRDPSPLEHNLAALGVELAQVDTIVISHAHFDHVGGRRFTDGDLSGTTFGIGLAQPDLSGKRVIVPVAMTYPGIAPELASVPTRIGPGVATTGTIARRLFGGWTDEQALAVNVEGRGIVLVVGCGHQTLERLLARSDALFDAPLYGVVGGLHFPVPEGRIFIGPFDAQRRFGSGDGPFAPLDDGGVDRELALLEARHLGLLSIGGHDSSDRVIANARARLPSAYRDLRVGEAIRVGP